jgi:hypothetical protein
MAYMWVDGGWWYMHVWLKSDGRVVVRSSPLHVWVVELCD